MGEEEDGSGNQCETGLDWEIEYGKKMVVEKEEGVLGEEEDGNGNQCEIGLDWEIE